MCNLYEKLRVGFREIIFQSFHQKSPKFNFSDFDYNSQTMGKFNNLRPFHSAGILRSTKKDLVIFFVGGPERGFLAKFFFQFFSEIFFSKFFEFFIGTHPNWGPALLTRDKGILAPHYVRFIRKVTGGILRNNFSKFFPKNQQNSTFRISTLTPKILGVQQTETTSLGRYFMLYKIGIVIFFGRGGGKEFFDPKIFFFKIFFLIIFRIFLVTPPFGGPALSTRYKGVLGPHYVKLIRKFYGGILRNKISKYFSRDARQTKGTNTIHVSVLCVVSRGRFGEGLPQARPPPDYHLSTFIQLVITLVRNNIHKWGLRQF